MSGLREGLGMRYDYDKLYNMPTNTSVPKASHPGSDTNKQRSSRVSYVIFLLIYFRPSSAGSLWKHQLLCNLGEAEQ